MQAIIVEGLSGINEVAKQLLAYGNKKRKFLFEGEIGAGKTTLIKAMCEALGVVDMVSSPTFSLVNEYEYSRNGKQCTLYHMDLYRLEDIEEALNIGIEEYLDNEAYCFIEWPELIEPILPEKAVRIKMEIIGDSSRKILFL
jgi:tRNA threonylcarbamoyladenosine biosynthesis protein TsaE